MTPASGYLRKDLEAMGVSWPPMKGWKELLMRGEDPNRGDPARKPGQPTRAELLATIAEQQAEIERLRLEVEVEEVTVRSGWLERIS